MLCHYLLTTKRSLFVIILFYVVSHTSCLRGVCRGLGRGLGSGLGTVVGTRSGSHSSLTSHSTLTSHGTVLWNSKEDLELRQGKYE